MHTKPVRSRIDPEQRDGRSFLLPEARDANEKECFDRLRPQYEHRVTAPRAS